MLGFPVGVWPSVMVCLFFNTIATPPPSNCPCSQHKLCVAVASLSDIHWWLCSSLTSFHLLAFLLPRKRSGMMG